LGQKVKGVLVNAEDVIKKKKVVGRRGALVDQTDERLTLASSTR